jgi:hypothetical protein
MQSEGMKSPRGLCYFLAVTERNHFLVHLKLEFLVSPIPFKWPTIVYELGSLGI